MSRRFRFPLERLRRVRAVEERLARAVWGRAEGEARAAEERLEEARAELRGGRRELGSRLGAGPLDPRTVLLEQSLLARLGRALAGRREEALTRRGQAERLAAAWRERRAAGEALERLRERARGAWRREDERREAAELDEVAALRSARGEAHRAPARPRDEPI